MHPNLGSVYQNRVGVHTMLLLFEETIFLTRIVIQICNIRQF